MRRGAQSSSSSSLAVTAGSLSWILKHSTKWLINRCLGIERDEQQPGFKHFYLRPVADPTGQMTYARGHYDSPYGRIESGWERKPNGEVEYTFTIPQGTTATVIIPGKEPRQMSAGTHTLR